MPTAVTDGVRQLVLFDIDQTLIDVGASDRRALARAIEDELGRSLDLSAMRDAGQTQRFLYNGAMAAAGVDACGAAALWEPIKRRYLAHLGRLLVETPGLGLKPGVRALLDALASRSEVALGLLTGNTAAAAALKLEHFGLAGYFAFGAFGDEAVDRGALVPVACAEAEARFGVAFAGKAIAIVGDTDLDVDCGTRWGARAIGVATGPQPLAALALCGADHLFPDLADTDAVLAALLG